MKKILALLSLTLLALSSASAQILTASSFFKSVSENYSTIKDYEADVSIKTPKVSMVGRASYKYPNLLRIDFTSPKDQVICYNGDMLTIYLPESSAILNQSVQNENGANMATAQGLSLLSRYYSVAYEIGQDAVPLEEGSEENVIKLVLRRRNMSEAFSLMKIAVSPSTMLIRRIQATNPQGQTFVFDFTNYVINKGIPDQRFVYDPPTSANNYNNFLFSE